MDPRLKLTINPAQCRAASLLRRSLNVGYALKQVKAPTKTKATVTIRVNREEKQLQLTYKRRTYNFPSKNALPAQIVDAAIDMHRKASTAESVAAAVAVMDPGNRAATQLTTKQKLLSRYCRVARELLEDTNVGHRRLYVLGLGSVDLPTKSLKVAGLAAPKTPLLLRVDLGTRRLFARAEPEDVEVDAFGSRALSPPACRLLERVEEVQRVAAWRRVCLPLHSRVQVHFPPSAGNDSIDGQSKATPLDHAHSVPHHSHFSDAADFGDMQHQRAERKPCRAVSNMKELEALLSVSDMDGALQPSIVAHQPYRTHHRCDGYRDEPRDGLLNPQRGLAKHRHNPTMKTREPITACPLQSSIVTDTCT